MLNSTFCILNILLGLFNIQTSMYSFILYHNTNQIIKL